MIVMLTFANSVTEIIRLRETNSVFPEKEHFLLLLGIVYIIILVIQLTRKSMSIYYLFVKLTINNFDDINKRYNTLR